MSSSHPSCSGRLVNPKDYDPLKTHPACVFVWEYEQHLKEQAGLIEESEEENDEEEVITSEPPIISEILEHPKLTKYHHGIFFAAHLKDLPVDYKSLSTNRVTVLHFAVTGLDMLGELDTYLPANSPQRATIIEWVYNLQVPSGGFTGSPNGAIGHSNSNTDSILTQGYLPATYSSLCVLKALGDDLSRVNKPVLLTWLQTLQLDSGVFAASVLRDEADMRFIYCACAISSLLNDLSALNVDSIVSYIRSSSSFDGGISLTPHGSEGHGGATYTAVASAYLLGRPDAIVDESRLLRWAICNQGHGYKGRVNKPCDCCYSYWVGATIELIGGAYMTHVPGNRSFNVQCEGRRGGFGKDADASAEILHSFYSVAGFAVMERAAEIQGKQFDYEDWSVNRIDPALGITHRAAGTQQRSPMFNRKIPQ